MPFVHACGQAALPSGRSRRLTLEGIDVTCWNAGGRIFAMNTACPHQHIPALHQGVLTGALLTCPMHGWTFSLETGRAEEGEGRLRLYPVEIRGGEIFVDISDAC